MYAILDIETTGGKFNEEGITEIAIYKYDGQEIKDQFSSLVNPEKEIQPFVQKLTGINTKMLRNAPKFYEIAKRTGIDRISAMANRLGLGVKTGIDLPGEKTGLIPTKKWKRGALDQPWHQGETLHAGIGQGYVLATPLQLAVMTAHLSLIHI